MTSRRVDDLRDALLAETLDEVARLHDAVLAIGPALEKAAGEGREAIKKTATREAVLVEAALAKSVGATANSIARQVAGRRLALASAASALAVSIGVGAFVAGWGVAYKAGLEAGARDALAQCRDDAAAASWATTPEGALARRFSALNPLEKMARCDGEGWRIKRQDGRRVCYPAPGYGWWMPSK